MNKLIAFRTTQTLLTAIGGVGMVAFAATLQWWLMLIGAATVGLTWFLLYKLLEGIASDSRPRRAVSDVAR